MSTALVEQIIRDLEALPEGKQLQVAAFIHSLQDHAAKGMSGKEAVLALAGSLDEESAHEMEEIIEEGCENIDKEIW